MRDVMVPFAAFLFCAIGAAVNLALYIMYGSPWSLGTAVFCGILALFNGAVAVRS